MSSPWSGGTRAARAGVFALLAVALAVGAHGLGGGRLPTWGAVLALWLAVLPIAGVLAGRTWAPGPLVGALGLLELGLHQALGLGSASSASSSTTSAPHHAVGPAAAVGAHPSGSHGAGHHGDTLGTTAHAGPSDAVSDAVSAYSSVYSSAGHDHHTGPLMLLGHVVATVLTALLLAHGDALLARLWAWATLRDLPPTDTPPLTLHATPPTAWRLGTVAPPLVAAGGVRRRGPPAA